MTSALQVCILFMQLQLFTSYIIPKWTILEDSVETVTDVASGEEKRFLVHRKDISAPVFLYVTPCGGAVHWRLYSMDKASLTDRLDDVNESDLKLIAGETDDRRMKFFSKHITSDFLLLVLTSSGSTSARLFTASSQWSIDQQYPPLPKDTRLAHALQKGIGETRQALVTWKIADAVRYSADNRYRICAVVSRRYPDWAVCDLLDEGLESIHCVANNNNSMIVNNLRSGKKYYISVFVRDALKGSTSSYETLELNLRKAEDSSMRVPRKDEVRLLPDSNLQSAYLPPKKASSLSYYYAVPQNSTRTQKVLLIAHACDGQVRMTIYRNGRILKKTEPFTGYRRFLVMNVRSGQLRFEISNDDARAKSVRLWASTRFDKSPYPMLPDDTSVKVVKRTCTTATLQWLRSADTRAEYCIYKRKEKAHYLEHLVSRVDNLCVGGLSSELVGCYHHKGPMSKTLKDPVGVIETTIDGLEPLSTYRFDLLASPIRRRGAQSLPYRTVWVRTVAC